MNWIEGIARMGVRISIRIKATGVNNMKDPNFLAKAQDTVWNDPRWKADTWPDGKPRTHCNQASLEVANAVGCHTFDPAPGRDPYSADELFHFFQRETSGFLEEALDNAQELANKGSLVYAIAPSWLLQEGHGHIASITPGAAVDSEFMKKKVPVCLNISDVAHSARLIGINWAFPLKRTIPRFYAWKESL